MARRSSGSLVLNIQNLGQEECGSCCLEDFTFDPATGALSILENGETYTVNLSICELMQAQTADTGLFIGG